MKNILPFFLLLSMTGIGYCSTLDDDMGIRAVIGEAGSSYEEMSAIANAIRNRGSFDKVYGLKRVKWFGTDLKVQNVKTKVWSSVDEKTFHQAGRAWWNSDRVNDGLDEKDPVKGATNWLSDWDIKNCKPSLTAFRFKMKETAYIGTTHFYKEKR